ncbi:type VI secretion system lipoprotein TssJ [Pseudomonas syringae pv. theae]|uniref:type VI secretion system lipoprotein TssJ n=1 Tax=Pseudomonas syringae TaxID=317 RepID=UPI00073F674E|nr:type VI secretion system lipoprotein TssJ [Pseudomonas syringae]MBL3829412.1 type VI secretion system lipoprotein TssJ [Pseudomonas syringae pv. theae]MBL3835365.1 type VI secretion system lipoprotein TssJ [Pseudomonas syringae pv. theae]MBL3869036.1 type VI secretion system lipoprotein TssJ [Pseudomonas syringae pv. theae]GKQ48529.1 type VI secretion system lipoprotein TssJ [Pseudomonas syringae pv. theae]GKS08172.1 type VI secretion system lipoprotein TssJ [Pseudomonas syringae pv. theae]
MSHTVFNLFKVAGLGALLGGCGLTQTLSDATTSTTKAIFYKHVQTLHLDFTGRAAMNNDVTDMSSLSVPTVVRVYQLRDNKTADKATYESLLSDADNLLRADLLDQRALVIRPAEGAQLDVPLNKDTKFVTVVALFRHPDTQLNTWRMTLPRDDLNPDRARVIELGNSRLTLHPLGKE